MTTTKKAMFRVIHTPSSFGGEGGARLKATSDGETVRIMRRSQGSNWKLGATLSRAKFDDWARETNFWDPYVESGLRLQDLIAELTDPDFAY